MDGSALSSATPRRPKSNSLAHDPRGGRIGALAPPQKTQPLTRSKMKLLPWASIKSWISLNLIKQPVAEMPREHCQHTAVCYVCPRGRCVGALNDRDDPDLTKPRPTTSGHCIVVPGAVGFVRLRVSVETANAHAARRAANEQEHIPPHRWEPPGYDEADLPAFLKSVAD